MVLTAFRLAPLCSTIFVAGLSVPAAAQQLDRATPLIEAPAEYNATPIQLGRLAAYVGADARLEYDSNIYALSSNKIDDERVTVSPWVNLLYKDDRFDLSGQARAVVRRYFSNKTENAEAATTRLDGTYRFSDADSFTANVGWTRLVEQRGEPESLTAPGTPPRRYDQMLGELGFSHQGARIILALKGSAMRNNALAAVDAERDYTQYVGSGRVGYRVSGIVDIFGEVFISARDFRLPVDSSGVDRDSKTYGARGGIAFEPGGLIRGEAAIGVFRFKPDDASQASRTGLSISAGLIYTPTPRLAITLDGFRGDVATVQQGAQSRTDTRFQLGFQNEIYHNLRWQGALIYRRTDFVGSAQHERLIAGQLELEYLFNRHLGVAVTGRLANRASTRPLGDFDRSIVGVELRLQY